MRVVFDLQVSVDSDRVTEGQNITLTCATSCPLTHTFIWLKNGVGLDRGYSSDQLHVSVVNREDSDRYSCALEHWAVSKTREKHLISVLLCISDRLFISPDVAYESAGIITLSSLLVCAALWMLWVCDLVLLYFMFISTAVTLMIFCGWNPVI